jgi:hypothetical protein
MDGVNTIRAALSENAIDLDILDDDTGIFDHVDVFVNLSRNNKTVERVDLYLPFTDPGDDASVNDRYAIWESIAESIGNLQALSHIIIMVPIDEDDEEAFILDWKILACILRRLRRGIELCMCSNAPPLLWRPETLQDFARVIHGQDMITAFQTGGGFQFRCLDILCSALLTLPALTNVTFEQRGGQGPEEGQSLESMIMLLQSPSLREIRFVSVVFTNTLSQAI